MISSLELVERWFGVEKRTGVSVFAFLCLLLGSGISDLALRVGGEGVYIPVCLLFIVFICYGVSLVAVVCGPVTCLGRSVG